jgi:hypothetical protein
MFEVANGLILVCQVALLAGLIYMMNDIIASWLRCLCKFEILASWYSMF